MGFAAPAKERIVLYTAHDIEAEHDAALASLTPAQRRAFSRLAHGDDGLERRFALEAEARSFRPANDDGRR